MADIEMIPAVVQSWGTSAHGIAGHVRRSKGKIGRATGQATAVLSGFESLASVGTFTDQWEKSLGDLADAMTGTGDNFSSSAAMTSRADGQSASMLRLVDNELQKVDVEDLDRKLLVPDPGEWDANEFRDRIEGGN